jgi:molybdate transport system ATP-binding protein
VNEAEALDVRVVHRVHPGLTLDLALRLGRECGVLFGASGAGKTTLLRLIAGLATPARGRVRLGETVVFDSDARVNLPLRRRQLGMIFQEDLLFPHLDVAANIAFGLAGRPRAEAGARLAEVAALCGVERLLKRRPDTLSGGERQRVGLARALAPRPRLLLCDEPVSALDLENRHALIARLQAVQRAEAIPLLYVTHSPAEAITLGARLFLLAGGAIVDQGDPLDVFARQARTGTTVPRLADVRNVFAARVEAQADDRGATVLRLHGRDGEGPTLIVPHHDVPPDTPLTVSVLAEEILLARGTIEGLSARNLIAGTVERVVSGGPDAEVLVRTGGLVWIVSVVAQAVAALGLTPGTTVHLIIKARSCHVHVPPPSDVV